MRTPDQDADMNDYMVELAKRELRLYPRSPVVVETQTARDIDMSGILRMTPEQIDEALRQYEAAA